jgi:DNA repair protein RecO (recombination protein O)
VPLYSADALVLRTYKLGEADRIVVFLTRDRGKKRGVAQSARRTRSRFTGALEPLTEVRVAYFEKEQRELVSLNYAEPVRSPLSTPNPDALGYSAYFAELIDAGAADADPDERLYRLGVATLEAVTAGGAVEPLARYFECWLLRLQGVYPPEVACGVCGQEFGAGDGAFLAVDGHGFVCRSCHGAHGTDDRYLSAQALAFLQAARRVRPSEAAALGASPSVLRELEVAHRALIAAHFDRTLRSVRVVQDLTRPRP